MKVKCMKGSKSHYITKGYIYEVVEENKNYYTIIDNTNTKRCFKKVRFEIVEDEK